MHWKLVPPLKIWYTETKKINKKKKKNEFFSHSRFLLTVVSINPTSRKWTVVLKFFKTTWNALKPRAKTNVVWITTNNNTDLQFALPLAHFCLLFIFCVGDARYGLNQFFDLSAEEFQVRYSKKSQQLRPVCTEKNNFFVLLNRNAQARHSQAHPPAWPSRWRWRCREKLLRWRRVGQVT